MACVEAKICDRPLFVLAKWAMSEHLDLVGLHFYHGKEQERVVPQGGIFCHSKQSEKCGVNIGEVSRAAKWLGGSQESKRHFDLPAHPKQWQSFKRKEIYPEAKLFKGESAPCLGMFAELYVDIQNPLDNILSDLPQTVSSIIRSNIFQIPYF